MYPYRSEADALTDVLRLSRGMTYKSAVSGLPLGGGKAVIIGDPRCDKTPALFEAFGRCVEQLGGRYVVAEDSGTGVDDLRVMATQTGHTSGITERPKPDGGTATGDPSPATAYGVFKGLEAAARHVLGREKLEGLKIAVQGAGSVGSLLADYLVEAGARVWVTDVFPERVERLKERLEVKAVAPEDIYDLDIDIFSPCALGAVLNDTTIPRLRARIVAGAANNQLAEPRHAAKLRERGICYVPDFVINAGGVIDIAGCRAGLTYEASMQQVAGIGETVQRVLETVDRTNQLSRDVAEQMARANLGMV